MIYQTEKINDKFIEISYLNSKFFDAVNNSPLFTIKIAKVQSSYNQSFRHVFLMITMITYIYNNHSD